MAKSASAKRRPDESHWAYRSRMIREKQEQRDKARPLVSPFTARHGNYVDDNVMHVETGTIAPTKRNKGLSSLVRMHQTGKLTNEQYEAAIRIARVAERIERSVAVRCASLEARVDNSGGSRNVLIEALSQVRDEMAYTRWRRLLPLPRRMILDMLLVDRALSTTARIYGMDWPRGRRLLVNALDLWIDLRGRVQKEVDDRDVFQAHARLAG